MVQLLSITHAGIGIEGAKAQRGVIRTCLWDVVQWIRPQRNVHRLPTPMRSGMCPDLMIEITVPELCWTLRDSTGGSKKGLDCSVEDLMAGGLGHPAEDPVESMTARSWRVFSVGVIGPFRTEYGTAGAPRVALAGTAGSALSNPDLFDHRLIRAGGLWRWAGGRRALPCGADGVLSHRDAWETSSSS